MTHIRSLPLLTFSCKFFVSFQPIDDVCVSSFQSTDDSSFPCNPPLIDVSIQFSC